MKTRLLTVLSLGLGVALLLAGGALAQGPPPDVTHPPAPYSLSDPSHPPSPNPHSPDVTANVTLGQPGTAFRYVGTFGATEQAYLADVQHLFGPHGLEIDDSGNVYIAEQLGQRTLKYNAAGQNVWSIGTPGLFLVEEYRFTNPKDVARDANGHLWVVDDHRLTQYDTDGHFLQVFPPWDENPWSSGNDNRHFDTPTGIAFDSSGRMYVADMYNHRVQVYTFSGGSPVYHSTIGVTDQPGSDDWHFNEPRGLVLDSADRLYAVDGLNYRVQRCTWAGGWSCTTFHGGNGPGSGADQLVYAVGLGIDSSDNLYIADTQNDRIKRCTTGGVCTTFASGLPWPVDVVVGPTGAVYISTFKGENIVRKYSSAGAYLGRFVGVSGVPYLTDGSHFNTPGGVAVDSSGAIYLTEMRGCRLLKLNAAGSLQWSAGTPGVWGDDNLHLGPWWWSHSPSVAVDARNGTVYVADPNNQRVQVYASNGSYLTTLGSTGNFGTGNDRFHAPNGVTVDSSGRIYVADSDNHRVQMFNSSRVYQATLGVPGQSGTDNAHFDHPEGVAADSAGRVYVADSTNHRVQRCTLSGAGGSCATFAGVTGQCGDDFSHLCRPRHVAVDSEGRVYVAEVWNQRVQIFDSSGAYLTTIGGAWGNHTGELREPWSVDVDAQGNVYVADQRNHRIQKFAPGVTGWQQVNINGFGDVNNRYTWAWSGVLGGRLYVAAGNGTTGAEVWRTADGANWTQVNTDGFGDANNRNVFGMVEFNGAFYFGTYNEVTGGEIWRYNGTAWTQVNADGFGDRHNTEVEPALEFGGYLWVSTRNETTGAEMWRYDGTTWSQANADGYGDPNNMSGALGTVVFNGALYAGTWNTATGGELWRLTGGGTWSQVGSDGLGDPDNWGIPPFAVYKGQLYVGTYNQDSGGQVWRYNGSTWQKVVAGGFGDADNVSAFAGIVLDDELYMTTMNWADGAQVWKTTDGMQWSQVAPSGFGDSTVVAGMPAALNNRLYIATWSNGAGAEVWRLGGGATYLPAVLKSSR